MEGFGIILLIFGILLLMAGLYIKAGHNNKLLLWKGYNKKNTKEELNKTGLVIIILSFPSLITGICALFFKEGSIIPFILIGLTFILSTIISIIIYKNK